MTEPRDRDALVDIKERCAAISRATGGQADRILNDEVVAAAVLYHLHVIGEATTRLSKAFRKSHPEIGWSGWRGFRIVSSHHYDRSIFPEFGRRWSVPAAHACHG